MNQPQIYLSSWAIKKSIENGERNVFDLPKLARKNDFQGIEIMDRHLPDLHRETFERLKNEIEQAGLGMTLGVSTDFTSEFAEELDSQINYAKSMIEVADFFRARSVRILLGGNDFFFQKWLQLGRKKSRNSPLAEIKQRKKFTNWLQKVGVFHLLHRATIQAKKPRPVNEENKNRVLKALDEILPLAEKTGIHLAIENHWGVSSLAENVLFFVNYYQSKYLGTCPDLGNFSRQQDRYRETAKLLPFAKEIHAKSYAFTDSGDEKTIDYGQMISLIQESQFSGPIVVEYEGGGDQLENSLRTRKLILKYWK